MGVYKDSWEDTKVWKDLKGVGGPRAVVMFGVGGGHSHMGGPRGIGVAGGHRAMEVARGVGVYGGTEPLGHGKVAGGHRAMGVYRGSGEYGAAGGHSYGVYKCSWQAWE